MNVVMTAAAASSKCRARPKARPSRAPRWTRCWRWPTRASANWWRRSRRALRAGLMPATAPGAGVEQRQEAVRTAGAVGGAAAGPGGTGRAGHRRGRGAAHHLHRERAGQGAPCGAASGRRGDRRRLGRVRRRAGRRAGRDLGALRRRGVAAGRPRGAAPRCRTPPTTRCCCSGCRAQADRRARFVSTLVAVRHADDPQPLVAVGRWPGEILDAPRGEGGFGYDPLMCIPELGATVAELDARRKNAHSHRARLPWRSCCDADCARPLAAVQRHGRRAVAARTTCGPARCSCGALPPLSLYVHLPWCLKKCPYCDFNSHEIQGRRAARRATWTRWCADLEAALPLVWGRRVVSVFIGGGTPSLFSPDGIDRLLADIRARLPLEPGAEITLEANPGTFERERFRAFRAAGVTRLSIGVQSFDDDRLQRHRPRARRRAGARRGGRGARRPSTPSTSTSCTRCPGRRWRRCSADLDAALGYRAAAPVDLPPDGRAQHRVRQLRPPALPDDDLASDMLDLITARCAGAGLQRYEVSAFARPGHRCAHNLNYWQFGDYLGIGAGAHGKLSFPHRVLRQVRWREPAAYMEQCAGRPGGVQRTRGGAARPAVRVHAQCAAPARRLRAGALSPSAPACPSRPMRGGAGRGRAARPDRARRRRHRAAAHGARLRFPVATCRRCSCRRAGGGDRAR